MTKAEREAAIAKHKEQIIAAVKGWLLVGVTEAEKSFGSGTGDLKLRWCYEQALRIFGPELANILTLEQFDALVQEPLDILRKMIQDNPSAAAYVNDKSTGAAPEDDTKIYEPANTGEGM